MFTEGRDTFSEVVDITLYKYNSIDVKIWGLIRRDAHNKKLTEDSYLIPVKQMQQYLGKWFSSEINRFQSVSDMSIHKEATSVYFIWQILQNTPNLLWIKVNLNKNVSYNRIVNIDQIKTIRYNIKTIRGSLRLFDLFATRELNIINDILNETSDKKNNINYLFLFLLNYLKILLAYLLQSISYVTRLQ